MYSFISKLLLELIYYYILRIQMKQLLLNYRYFQIHTYMYIYTCNLDIKTRPTQTTEISISFFKSHIYEDIISTANRIRDTHIPKTK